MILHNDPDNGIFVEPYAFHENGFCYQKKNAMAGYQKMCTDVFVDVFLQEYFTGIISSKFRRVC